MFVRKYKNAEKISVRFRFSGQKILCCQTLYKNSRSLWQGPTMIGFINVCLDCAAVGCCSANSERRCSASLRFLFAQQDVFITLFYIKHFEIYILMMLKSHSHLHRSALPSSGRLQRCIRTHSLLPNSCPHERGYF